MSSSYVSSCSAFGRVFSGGSLKITFSAVYLWRQSSVRSFTTLRCNVFLSANSCSASYTSSPKGKYSLCFWLNDILKIAYTALCSKSGWITARKNGRREVNVWSCTRLIEISLQAADRAVQSHAVRKCRRDMTFTVGLQLLKECLIRTGCTTQD